MKKNQYSERIIIFKFKLWMTSCYLCYYLIFFTLCMMFIVRHSNIICPEVKMSTLGLRPRVDILTSGHIILDCIISRIICIMLNTVSRSTVLSLYLMTLSPTLLLLLLLRQAVNLKHHLWRNPIHIHPLFCSTRKCLTFYKDILAH